MTIAVVGNATSLLNSTYGEEIDGHSTVVRFNQGVPIKPEAQGTKTTIVVTYHEDKLESIKPDWKDYNPDWMIIDPHRFKGTHALHPSTLMAYLILQDGLKGVSVYGVDHNKSWSFYQDHKGYNHNWAKEEKLLNHLAEKNGWRIRT